MTTRSVNINYSSIKKFDGTDFSMWKFLVTSHLKVNKLFYVLDTTKKPTDARDLEKWTEDDDLAQHLFITSLEYNILRHIKNLDSAADMWKNLITIHEPKTDATLTSLQAKFFDFKIDSSDTMSGHLAELDDITSQLAARDAAMPESAILAKIISALPPAYDGFTTSWDSVIKKDQTLQNLKERLLKEEVKVKRKETIDCAMVSNSTINQEKPKKPIDKKKSKCGYCKKTGHWWRECRKRLADEKSKEKANAS